MEESNIEVTLDGLVEKSSGRKIVSPIDSKIKKFNDLKLKELSLVDEDISDCFVKLKGVVPEYGYPWRIGKPSLMQIARYINGISTAFGVSEVKSSPADNNSEYCSDSNNNV